MGESAQETFAKESLVETVTSGSTPSAGERADRSTPRCDRVSVSAWRLGVLCIFC